MSEDKDTVQKEVQEVVKEEVKETSSKPLTTDERIAAAQAEWKLPEKVGTNALKLPFPVDPNGAMAALRVGGLKAVNRIKGDPAKLEAFKRVLQVLLKYANEKTVVEADKRKAAKENAISASARVKQRQVEAAQARIAELEKQAKHVAKVYGLNGE